MAERAESRGTTNRDAIGVGLAAALAVSLVVHFGTALMFVQFGGQPNAGGEDGNSGAGGVTMDITVEGARDAQLQPAVAPSPPSAATAPTPAATSTPEAVEAPRPAVPRVAPPRSLTVADSPVRTVDDDAAQTRRDTQPPDTTQPEVARPNTATSPNATPSAAQNGLRAMGTDAAETSGGRARGAAAVRALILGSAGFMPTSVEGQRALLPAATTCDDPVSGVWRALKYSPVLGGQWVRFTLLIRRDGADGLTGSIRSRIWNGTPSDRVPPRCSVGTLDKTHAMVAHGHVRGEQITFGSRTHRLVTDHCPQLFATSAGYAPDNFSGTIDTMRQEFQSVNNDGAYDINTPYVFRRVGCLEERDTPASAAGEE